MVLILGWIVEACLLHSKSSDEYHGAYDRARLSTERQRLMDDWGKFCFSLVSDNLASISEGNT